MTSTCAGCNTPDLTYTSSAYFCRPLSDEGPHQLAGWATRSARERWGLCTVCTMWAHIECTAADAFAPMPGEPPAPAPGSTMGAESAGPKQPGTFHCTKCGAYWTAKGAWSFCPNCI